MMGVNEMIQVDKHKFGPWALVTGASSGIGEEFARQLAANGFNLVLVARRLPLLENVAQRLTQQYYIQVRTLKLDLTEPDFLEKIDGVTRDLDIGLLVSNAGTGNPGAFLGHESALLQNIVQLNVVANLKLTHHFGQKFAQRGRGGIVLVSAMGASGGLPYMANDAATKAYLVSLGQALNIEFQKLGVHISVLLPGPTETPILDKLGFSAADMPMKPMPVEQCVAEGLAALNANRAAHLTGRLNRLMIALIPPAITRKMLGTMIHRGVQKMRNERASV
jgi:uncharacterized protein